MKDEVRQNASLEALSKKSFKKYLKSLIKDKRDYLDKSQRSPHAYPYFDRAHAEYAVLCQVLDDYKYHQARRKDLKGAKNNKGFKENECRI